MECGMEGASAFFFSGDDALTLSAPSYSTFMFMEY